MAIKTVLLAVGPSDGERADALTNIVVDIAGPTGAEVILVHVFTNEELQEIATQLDFENPANASPLEVATRQASIRDITRRLDDANIEFQVTSEIGDHGDRIVDIAHQKDVDLVVVGGRKRSPAGKAVFGSTAQQVMLESPAPVTFVRRD